MELSPDDPRPVYLQIAATLRRDISTGELKPGSRLPSGRELAKKFGTALMTVQHALRVLREEGLVMSQQGRGVFVRAMPEPPVVEAAGVQPSWASLAPQLEAIHCELRKMNQRLAAVEHYLGDRHVSAEGHHGPRDDRP